MNRSEVIALLIFILGFIAWWIQRSITVKADERARLAEEKRKAIAESHEQVLTRISVLEQQYSADSQTLALLKQEMLPMAEAMKRKLIDILTHPSDHFELPDALLKKARKRGAAMPDELVGLLAERTVSTDPHVTEQEKLAAEALPIIIKLAQLEAEDEENCEITGVQLVTSTAKTHETKGAEEGTKPEPKTKKQTLETALKDLIIKNVE